MDYILKRFEASINLSKPGQTERFNYLKARIEYIYYLLLGYTWNKYKNEVRRPELKSLFDSLDDKMTLGSIIGFIKRFDRNKEVLNSDTQNLLTEYNQYRIENSGHGNVYNSKKAEDELNRFFHQLCERVELLQKETDIIVVTDKTGETLEGYCVSSDSQFPELWNCHESAIDDCVPPCVFYRIKGLSNYYQLSPFIHINRDLGTNLDFYMFFSSKDMPIGKAKYTALFMDGKKEFDSPQLEEMIIVDNYRKISGSGVYMNLFDTNYKKFVDVGVRKTVDNFVRNNKAHVTAVLSGNGGVGKTACAQKVCMDLFSEKSCPYKFIVFASAKDRRFDERIGKIEEIKSRVNNYYDVIVTIYRTLNDKDPDFTDEGAESFTAFVDSFCEGKSGEKILLVVDDFETFDDEEKEKIAAFLGNLDINKHKVIVTTRNRALVDGFKIQTDSFDEDGTISFIRAKMEELYPQQVQYFNELVGNEENKENKEHKEHKENRKRIHIVTDGVPIFMIQWIHLFAQKHDGLLSEDTLNSREEARNFLVGRVYKYFKNNARILYAALSRLADKGKLFNKDTLKSICEKSIEFNTFEDSFDELVRMNVVEPYASQNTFRVYNESFMDDMVNRFSSLHESTRSSINNKLNQNFGGRVISSPYDSLLAEAKTAYIRGSINTAESTYRQVINNPDFPNEKRTEALTQLIVMFTTNERYNDAIYTFNEYKEFSDNPKVVERYIWALWGCTVDEKKNYCKETVFEFLERYFSKPRPVNDENISAYALGATYYSRYVLKRKNIKADKLEKAFDHCYNVFKYVNELSDIDFQKKILKPKTVKQHTDTALIQGFDIAAYLYETDASYITQVAEIASFYFNKYPQTSTNRKHITKALRKLGISNKEIKEIQEENKRPKTDSSGLLYEFHYLLSITNPQNGKIQGYLGIVDLENKQIKALLHISECAKRIIAPDEKLDFEEYLRNKHNIKVRIKQTDNGWSASLIGVTPSFDDYLKQQMNVYTEKNT